MYLDSKAVGVFPTTGRPQKDPLGRLTTEYNLTSLINTLLDVDGFVITHQALENPLAEEKDKKIMPFKTNGNNINTDIPFQFNIKGYIFTIHNLKDFLNDSNISSLNPDSENVIPIYASIELKLDAGSATTSTRDENLNRIQSIVGIDDDKGKYKGLRFDNVANDEGRIYLKILEKRTDGWYIPEESKIKLKTSKAGDNRSVSIDDGEIE